MGFLAPIGAAIATSFAAATPLELTAAAVTAAGTAYGAYSANQSAQYQGKVADQNAKITEQNRQAALQEGAAQESIQRTATGRRIGAALAAQGASGFDVNFGSPQEYRGALQNEGDLDAEAIRYGNSKNALAYANQAAGFSAEASGYRSAAANSLIGGTLNTASSFLSSASSSERRRTQRASVGVG